MSEKSLGSISNISRIQKELSTRNKYVHLYNESVQKNGKLIAFSSLSQTRSEVKLKTDLLEKRIKESLKRINSFIENTENDNWEVEKLKKSLSIEIAHTFPKRLYPTQYDISKSELLSKLKTLCKKDGNSFFVGFRESVNQAYRDKEILEHLFFDLHAISSVTDRILSEHYPDKLSDFTEQEVKNEEKTVGRKLDSSAPQKPIKEKVEELSKLERFKNDKGEIKPTTITKELMDNNSKLLGDLSERTVFRRVKRAIDNMT